MITILKNNNQIQLDDFKSDVAGSDKLMSIMIGSSSNNFMDRNSLIDIMLYLKDSLYIVNGDFYEMKSCIEECSLIMYDSFKILPFLYTNGIIPVNVYDLLISERVMHLGDDSFQASIIDILKYNGLFTNNEASDEYLISIYSEVKRRQGIKAESDFRCMNAITLENLFTPVLAYISWCGFKMDSSKWDSIVDGIKINNQNAKTGLDEFVYKYFRNNGKLCKIDTQGDLFEGFRDVKKCNINWRNQDKVNMFINEYLTAREDYGEIEPEFNSLVHAFNKSESVCKAFGKNYNNSINVISGRIHPIYRQLTNEGRISSPTKMKNQYGGDVFMASAMNLPKEYREAVVPEDGNSIMSFDWQASEMSIIASVSNDSRMLSIINLGKDIHEYVGNMFGLNRDDGKRLNFMVVYGANDYGIASKFGISNEKAVSIIRRYADEFKGVAKFVKQCNESAITRGYIQMYSEYGYRKMIPDIERLRQIKAMFTPQFWKSYQKIKNNPGDMIVNDVKMYFKRKQELDVASVNSKIQNIESVMLKLAMVYLFRYIIKNSLFGIVKIIIPLHDSIVVECPDDIKEHISEKVVKCMNKSAGNICGNVKINVHVKEGKCFM